MAQRSSRPAVREHDHRPAVYHLEQLPVARNALQLPAAPVDQRNLGASYQVTHRARDDDLAWSSRGQDPGGDVDGDSSDIVPAQLDLTSVQACPYPQVNISKPIAQRHRASDGTAGTVEDGEQTVPRRLDEPAAPLLHQTSSQVIVDSKQLPPAAVTQLCSLLGGACDIGEKHGGQHPGGGDPPASADQELLDHL